MLSRCTYDRDQRACVARHPTPCGPSAPAGNIEPTLHPTPSPSSTHNVLFIGNSYSWHLSSNYASLAHESHPSVLAYRYAPGKAWLMAASANPYVHRLIAGSAPPYLKWDYIVLQEQSQIPTFQVAPPYTQYAQGFAASMQAVIALARAARAVGARTALFMTWAHEAGDEVNALLSPTFEKMAHNLHSGYVRYLEAILDDGGDALLVPVGAAWRQVHDSNPSLFRRLNRHDQAGSHPTIVGEYLTASVFYVRLHPQMNVCEPARADAACALCVPVRVCRTCRLLC